MQRSSEEEVLHGDPNRKSFLLGVRTAGFWRVLGGSRRDLSGFAVIAWQFSVDSHICSTLLAILVFAGIGVHFWSSGGPKATKMVPGWPKRWLEGAQGDPKND